MGVDWVLCLKTEQAEQRNKEYTRRERESKGELKKTGGEEERHVFFHNGYFFFSVIKKPFLFPTFSSHILLRISITTIRGLLLCLHVVAMSRILHALLDFFLLYLVLLPTTLG